MLGPLAAQHKSCAGNCCNGWVLVLELLQHWAKLPQVLRPELKPCVTPALLQLRTCPHMTAGN